MPTTTTKRTTTRRTKSSAASSPAPVKEEPVEQKQHKPDDLIPCKSLTAGKMIYIGARTNISYVWVNAGDVAYIEYQDLMSAILSRSNYVYMPRFVIEDETIINDPRWSELKDIYNNLYDAGDIRELLSDRVSVNQFKQALKMAPSGLVMALRSEIAQGIQNGSFDSIGKVRAIDELLGTKMVELLG